MSFAVNRDIENKNTLNIYRLEHLALQMHIPPEEIIEILENIKSHYSIMEEKQYNPDGTLKKIRIVYEAVPALKKILKAINKYLLKKIKLPEYIHGSRTRHSIHSNAESHVGKYYVFSLDIKNFFPSVSANNVYNLFKRLKCSHEVAKILEKICTADDHLPQGYNTSSYIANLIILPTAMRIHALCKKQGLNASFYVDDITISGNKDPEKLFPTINRIITECGFKLNMGKKVCKKATEQKKVTGIIVNKKMNIEKAQYRKVRAIINMCKKHGHTSLLGRIQKNNGDKIATITGLKNHLRGKLTHFAQTNREKTHSLEIAFNEINWT